MNILQKTNHGYMPLETWQAMRALSNYLFGLPTTEETILDFLTEGEGEGMGEYQWDIQKEHENKSEEEVAAR